MRFNSRDNLASVPMAWGYVMLVLSIVFNGWRYNLESAAMGIRSASIVPMSVWTVIMVGSYTGATAFFRDGLDLAEGGMVLGRA